MLTFFILIILYYIYQYFTNHFWFQFSRHLHSGKFYIGNLDNSVVCSRTVDAEKLEQLYKQYFSGVRITKALIQENCKNTNFNIIYKKSGSKIIASVFNWIYPLTNGKIINYVDAAIVDKNYRNRNIFSQLMPYVSKNAIDNNANYIVFKIDGSPIPTFRNYKFISKNYLLNWSNLPNETSGVKKILSSSSSIYNFQPILNKQFLKDKIALKCGKSEMILRKQSKDNMEILYTFGENKEELLNILGYCKINYKSKYLTMDAIGGNSKLLEMLPFKYNYSSYHYVLGYNGKINEEDFMC